jgi:GAF domain-containing protein
MNRIFGRYFNPYNEEPKTVRRQTITLQLIVLGGALSLVFFTTGPTTMLILAASILVTLLLSLAGLLWIGQLGAPLAVIAASTVFMLDGSGAFDAGVYGLIGGAVVAGLLIGINGLIGFGVLGIGIYLVIGISQLTGQFIPPIPPVLTTRELLLFPLIFATIIIGLRTQIAALERVAIRARANEQIQLSTNQELLQLKSSLETRIAERTSELEQRAAQLETIASIARSVTGVQDLEQLLPSICQIVSDKFAYYHIGIFLIDARSEYAVLMATNSPGGRKMLQRGHRLRVGTTGIVGYVAAHGEARIALDVGEDTVFFNNPDLPTTRSEIALPLKTGEQTIGVLDVQSEQLGMFKQEDIATLGILADQVAVAIENSRLFSQTKQSLTDSQSVYQQFIKQDWSTFATTVKNTGYSYDGLRTLPFQGAPPTSRPNSMDIPIKIRGLTIGNITLRSSNPMRAWSPGEIQLAQAAAERAGLAIENYRLLSDAQRRAVKERTIGEITSRIGSSVDINSILQTAVEELGKTLSGSEVVLQFTPETEGKTE